MISKNVLDHVLERFRSLFNGFEHSKLYVDGMGLGWMGWMVFMGHRYSKSTFVANNP